VTAALRLVDGGGEHAATRQCMVCAVAHHGPCGLLARHADHMRLTGRAESTIYQRQRFLARLAAALPVPAAGATAADLAAWRAGLRGTGGTVRTNVGHLHAFYGWLVWDGYRDDNPSLRVLVPRRPRSVPRPISEDDLMLALRYAPRRVRPWVLLGGWAGLRAKEVALLRAENIRLAGPRPVIVIATDATKGFNERVIPVCPFLAAELEAAGLPSRGWAFPRLDGRPGPMTPGTVSAMVAGLFRRLGIPATFHNCRHRFGTETYRATRDLLAVSALLGHSAVTTTAGYAAYADESQVDAVLALPVPGPLPRFPGRRKGNRPLGRVT